MSKSSKVVLNVLITAVLLVTLDAYDEECEPQLQVRRSTVYETFPGQQLRIDCPVVFCSNSSPTVNWYKIEDQPVHVNNDNNHIVTGWETSGLSKGIFYLIFKNIISSDSGVYRCESGGSIGHTINIIVYDEECTTELQIRRNTVYKTFPGQQLRIYCPVVFCSNSPPTVDWYKIEDKRVYLNNGNNHILTGRERSALSKWIFYLIFKNIVSSDSGIYRCESGGTVSHYINIIVYGNTEPTTSSQPWKSSTTERAVTQGIFWPCMYRVITLGAFFLIVISTCIISKAVLRGTCRKTAEPRPESSDEIYDDIQV